MAGQFIEDFFRSVHEAEFERRDKHDSTDGFLLAVVTLLGGIGLHYLEIMPTSEINRLDLAFLILAGLFAIAWSAAVICVSGSVLPRNVGYLSDPRDLENFAKDLAAYHRHQNVGNAGDVFTEKEFREFAQRQYVASAEVNRASNQKKQKWQSRAKYCSIIAIFCVLFNVWPTYAVKASHSNVDRVQLIEPASGIPVKIVPPPTRESRILSNEQPKPADAKVQPPTRPEEPKIVVLREDKDPSILRRDGK